MGFGRGVRICEAMGLVAIHLKADKLLSGAGECYSRHWRRRPKHGFRQPTLDLFIFTRFSFYFFYFYFFYFLFLTFGSTIATWKIRRRKEGGSRRQEERKKKIERKVK
jgi:hypothetical protein